MVTLPPKSFSNTEAAVKTQGTNIIDLIARAPWREAVSYRETWPHEYVVIQSRACWPPFAGAFCRSRASRAGSSISPASTFSWATTNTGR